MLIINKTVQYYHQQQQQQQSVLDNIQEALSDLKGVEKQFTFSLNLTIFCFFSRWQVFPGVGDGMYNIQSSLHYLVLNNLVDEIIINPNVISLWYLALCVLHPPSHPPPRLRNCISALILCEEGFIFIF